MKLRITTKTILGLTAAIGCLCAWYGSALRNLQLEKAAITEINAISPVNVRTENGGGCTCGNWSGTRLEIESTAPFFVKPILQRFGIVAFDRVLRIEFDDTHDARLVALADRFTNLRSIKYRYSAQYLTSERKHTISSMTGALTLYAALKRNIAVTYPTEEQLAKDGVFELSKLDLDDDPYGTQIDENKTEQR